MTADFRGFARAFFELIRKHELPPLASWQSAKVSQGKPAAIEAAIDALPAAVEPKRTGPVFIQFESQSNVIGSVKFHPDCDGVAFSSANLQWITRGNDSMSDWVAYQRRCVSVCRGLLRGFHVHSADLRPEAGGVECIPDVPLVDRNSHVVVTNHSEARDLYDDPEVFWNAGWSVIEQHEGQTLLARELDVVCGRDYLDRIIDDQWTMARAAKPGETGYSRPQVLPDEVAIFRRGEARLQSVGYSSEDKLLEYSCTLSKGQHIQGWEIYSLLNIIEQGHAADGSIVKTLRVVFLHRWAAEQERRPLLDIGCRVYHYRDDGELHELTE